MHSVRAQVVRWGPAAEGIFADTDAAMLTDLASRSGQTGGFAALLAQYGDASGHNSANAVTFAAVPDGEQPLVSTYLSLPDSIASASAAGPTPP